MQWSNQVETGMIKKYITHSIACHDIVEDSMVWHGGTHLHGKDPVAAGVVHGDETNSLIALGEAATGSKVIIFLKMVKLCISSL